MCRLHQQRNTAIHCNILILRKSSRAYTHTYTDIYLNTLKHTPKSTPPKKPHCLQSQQFMNSAIVRTNLLKNDLHTHAQYSIAQHNMFACVCLHILQCTVCVLCKQRVCGYEVFKCDTMVACSHYTANTHTHTLHWSKTLAGTSLHFVSWNTTYYRVSQWYHLGNLDFR